MLQASRKAERGRGEENSGVLPTPECGTMAAVTACQSVCSPNVEQRSQRHALTGWSGLGGASS